METKRWAAKSLNRLLNIKHHHIVFTLPKPFRGIAKMNEKLFYQLLFTSTSMAIMDWFKYKHNIRPGIVSVLHTSGSDLKYHPHIHMIVTGGGQNISSQSIHELKGYFLTRQRFLASKFKQFFFQSLFQLANADKLKLPRRSDNDKTMFFSWARRIRDKHWIVSIQKPLNDISQIVGYVGRYTKRACLSEYKIQQVSDTNIQIKYNDYKNTPKNSKPFQSIKQFTISSFLDALLQHVPIKGFKMVRYYGLYSSHYRSVVQNNRHTTTQNNKLPSHVWTEFEQYRKLEIDKGKSDPLICPNCNTKLYFHAVIYSNRTFIHDT